jgi:O-antigen/teichoic acid export membrane protein
MIIVHGACDLGLGTAAVRLASERRDPSERRSLFATAVLTRASVGLLVTALVVVAREPLAYWLTGSRDNARILTILALTRPLPLIFDVFIDELRARGAMKQVSGLVFLAAFFVQALGVLFAVVLHNGLEGLAWARFLGDVLGILPAVFLCLRYVRARPNGPDLRRLLAFGWPLGMVYALGTLRFLDRPVLRALTSAEHVAAYELAVRLVGPVGLVNIALGTVLEPFVYGQSQSERTPALVDTFVRAYVTVFAIVAMAVSVLAPELVPLFFPKAYDVAAFVLPSLAFAATCEGLQRASGIGADLAKRTRVWAVSSLLTLGVGFGLLVDLVPRLGLTGAGFAWLIANSGATLIVYRAARSLSAIELPVARALVVIWAGSLIATAGVVLAVPLAFRVGALIAFAVVASVVMRARLWDLRRQLDGSQ